MENSKRKPYVRPVKANWWANKGFYTAYMLREGTVIPVLFFVFEILALFLMTACAKDVIDVQAKLNAWRNFMTNPIIIIANIVVLIAVLYHAITWFALMPKAQRLFLGDKLVDGKYFVWALYAVLFFVTVGGIIVFFTNFLWTILK